MGVHLYRSVVTVNFHDRGIADGMKQNSQCVGKKMENALLLPGTCHSPTHLIKTKDM